MRFELLQNIYKPYAIPKRNRSINISNHFMQQH